MIISEIHYSDGKLTNTTGILAEEEEKEEKKKEKGRVENWSRSRRETKREGQGRRRSWLGRG